MRAGQGHADILELLQEDAELYFPKFGLAFGRNSFLEWLRDNWETAGESDGIGPPGWHASLLHPNRLKQSSSPNHEGSG